MKTPNFSYIYIYLLSLTQSPQRSREKQILSKHRSLKDTDDGRILRATANIICFKLLCQFAKGFTITGSKSAKFRSHSQKFNYTVETLIQRGKAVIVGVVSVSSLCVRVCALPKNALHIDLDRNMNMCIHKVL